jgi:hypothetical protein
MAERAGLRRVAVVVAAVMTTGLAFLTVLGMESGHERQFDRGVAPRDLVAIQLGLGVVFVAIAVFVGWSLVGLWQGKAGAAGSVARWFALAVVLWVAWWCFRVLQYAS